LCWSLSAPQDYAFRLHFNYFATEADRDYVRIHDGPDTGSDVLLTASGYTIPKTVYSASNRLLFVFFSDDARVAQGFKVTAYSNFVQPTTPTIEPTTPTIEPTTPTIEPTTPTIELTTPTVEPTTQSPNQSQTLFYSKFLLTLVCLLGFMDLM